MASPSAAFPEVARLDQRSVGPAGREPTSTRGRLIEAALAEFSSHGFDGASTRAIAQRAGVHQPLINYHFSSKAELWRTAVGMLFSELAEAMASVIDAVATIGVADADVDRPEVEIDDALLCGFIDVLVRFAAQRPELNRIMVAEATADSERLRWITDTYTADAFTLFSGIWNRLRRANVVVDLDPMIAYYTVVGASSLLYANAPEARRITGREPIDPSVVGEHAASLCRMLRVGSHETHVARGGPQPREDRS